MPSDSLLPQWFRVRRYLHFDRPIGAESARRIVRSPSRVATHSFFPLIAYKAITQKVWKSSAGILEQTRKERGISYAGHIDSHIYSYYAYHLNTLYEDFLRHEKLEDSVLAFRPTGKSNIDFAEEAFSKIETQSSCAAIGLDVTGFFDNIHHRVLKQQWATLLGKSRLHKYHYNIYKSITKFSIVDREELFSLLEITKSKKKNITRVCSIEDFRRLVRKSDLIKTNRKGYGIPQGTPISAVLSNIYMMRFDMAMRDYASRVNGSYFRYCDDILLIVPISLRAECAGVVQQELTNIELRINPNKTVISTFDREDGVLNADKPLQYLGFIYDGQRKLIRSAALAKYSQKMKKGVRLAAATQRRWNDLRQRKGNANKKLYRKSLYKKYSHIGNQNFLSYGYRAARKMNSPAIRKQLKPLWNRLLDEIDRREN